MNHRDRMLAAIAGKPTDRVPYAPRLDLWYRANARAGTLPRPYKNATLDQILADEDLGYHAVIPDFKDLRSPEDDIDRALGMYNIHTMPVKTILEDVTRNVRIDGETTLVEYTTPEGTIRAAVRYTEEMAAAGATISIVTEHAFKTPEDYAALGHIFRHARVEKNYDGYRRFKEKIGDRGIAVCSVNSAGSPMQYIMRDLMDMKTFFLEMHDRPGEMSGLAESVGVYFNKILDACLDCPAEVYLLGANYDASVTYPPFFKKHILPSLKAYADKLHARGKYLLTHADGENTGLLDHFLAAGIDVADSICPKPMTKLTYKEVRERFDGRITIMGGVPSVALLPESMNDRDYKKFLDEFFDALGKGDHAILGISDTTPPGADFERILEIRKRTEIR